MTKEWRTHSEEEGGEERGGRGEGGGVDMRRLDSEEEQDVQSLPTRPPTRHSIITGFTNVKKELSILFPLSHPHVVKLFGVMLRPMGLVLELAPKGSLKKILGHYHEVHAKLQARAMQRVLMQVASAIQYLHQCNIIYRDLKSDNVLVWRFPEPRDSIPLSLSSDMGTNSVLVKLSDYGISQFVATQGARGMVGTAGFIAPEILKYHGKEVYDQQVDLFSFGMFLYELLTLHIPYESLAIQQANQANERGTRPSLTKRDFPCPVLVRELMVWCWQQFPDHRPSAETIIATARTDEFPRLLDGIRICNSGHVTATCMRIISSGQSTRQRRESRLLSPSPTSFPLVGGAVGRAGSLNQESSLPQLEVVSEEGRESDNVFEYRGSKDAPLSQGGRREGATPPLLPHEEVGGDKLSGKRDNYRQHSASFLQRQLSADELQLKRASPYYMEEEAPVCEMWVASSDARHSTITVIDYAQQFTQIEDVEVGDSPVLCLCLVQRKVWMGMEMGCLMVYDANTRKPYLQTWIKHYKKMLSMTHLPPLHLVYVGLEDGSILAFSEDLPSQPLISLDPSLTNPPLVSLSPVTQYRDSSQSCSCLLAIPRTNPSNQSCGVDHVEPSGGGGESYELWVGQKGNRITVLDAASLRVVKFLHNELDQSMMPTFVAYLSCSHLVYGCSSARGAVKGEGPPGSCDHMSVYSALYHGQYVTRWSAELKKPVDCFDCRPYGKDEDCSITALLFSRMELIVGLNCGLILILHPCSFSLLCSLACHRAHISSLLSLDISSLQLQPATSSQDMAAPISHGSAPSSGFSSDSSSPINNMGCSVCRLSPVGSTSGSSPSGESGNRLLSFGTGFKSYYDAPECNHHHKSGFLLVWDSENWPEPTTTS